MEVDKCVIQRIAKSEQASVYKASIKEDYFGEEITHRYALKVFFNGDEAMSERKNMDFINDYSHVIAPRGCILLRGERFLAYEYADMSLDDLIDRKQTWLEIEVVMLVGQIICGLFEIHRYMLFHLDIKPANILMVDHKAKVGDLGMAVQCFGTHLKMNQTRGTLGFQAPETKSGVYTKTTDFYSLGKLMLCFCEKKGDVLVQKSKTGSNTPVTPNFTNFVKKLLVQTYETRLGSDGYLEFWYHPLYIIYGEQLVRNFKVSYD